jgi:hypothetical protein
MAWPTDTQPVRVSGAGGCIDATPLYPIPVRITSGEPHLGRNSSGYEKIMAA